MAQLLELVFEYLYHSRPRPTLGFVKLPVSCC